VPYTFDHVPPVFYHAVEYANPEALIPFRASLKGDELMEIDAALELFDFMASRVETDEDGHAQMAANRKEMVGRGGPGPILGVLDRIEEIARRRKRAKNELFKKSPALAMMQSLLESVGKPDDDPALRKRLRSVPGEIAAAVETRRTQLLGPLRNRIKQGSVFSEAEREGILGFITDHANANGLGDGFLTVPKNPRVATSEDCLTMLNCVSSIIDDMVHRDYAGSRVADGQGRSCSFLSL
jgi:hypothetical protein